ncbi:MAG: hypothetical protein Q9166_006869 [cf. Caloplaca sp. 2 TL-2023]
MTSTRFVSLRNGVLFRCIHHYSVDICCRPTVQVAQARRGLISTTTPTNQSPTEAAKDVASSSTSPSLIKVTDLPAPHTGHIRVITLNSPRNKNAISRQLLKELDIEFRRIQTEVDIEYGNFVTKKPEAALGQGTRVVIVGSEVDGIFCAGADLKERKEMTRVETDAFLEHLRRLFRTVGRLSIPSISAMSSLAFGGGLELGLATTFRVFSPATVVGLPETRLGIIPGAGGTYRLRNLIGSTRSLDLVLTGRTIRGEEAFRMGLCDRLAGPSLADVEQRGVKDNELRRHVLRDAIKMATDICEGGPVTTRPAIFMTKNGRSLDEKGTYEQLLTTQDRDEALKAFAEKRKPVFRGR